MKKKTEEVDWEAEYKQSELWEKSPHKYSLFAAKEVPSGKVLDLGCGEGYDCLYFASKKYNVLGIDVSESAIDRLKNEAEKNNLKIRTVVEDFNNFEIKENFDVVLSYGALQFFGDRFLNLISELKSATNKGGVHSFYIFGDNGDFNDLAKHRFYFPAEQELKDLYSDWEILEFESKKVKLLIKGDNGEDLYNSMYKILVRKL